MQHTPHTGYAHLKTHLEAWPHRPQAHETASFPNYRNWRASCRTLA